MTEQAVAAADELVQAAFAIHQGHGDAVDLGLNPDVLSGAEPITHFGCVQQLPQTGMGDRVADCATSACQRIVSPGCGLQRAFAPMGQATPGLVVQFIADGGLTLSVVGVIPLVTCLANVSICARASSGQSSAQARHARKLIRKIINRRIVSILARKGCSA